MWKERVRHVSDRIFPGLVNNYDYGTYLNKGNEVLVNLPLQVTLYFNILFSPCWLVVILEMFPMKYELLNSLHRFVVVLVNFTVTGVEFIRLYMGYCGNLREQIPEIAGFWLLTVLLQFPLQMFLLVSPGFPSFPIERIMQTFMCLFLTLELSFGFVALRRSARHSVRTFHLTNFRLDPERQ